MANGHTPRSSEQGAIKQFELAEEASLGGLMEYVPGYQPPVPRAALTPKGLGGPALEKALAPPPGAALALPPGIRPEEMARAPGLLFDASFLSPVTTMKSIVGDDDRTVVPNVVQVPWRAICALRITTALGVQLVGTGWFIDPRTVITAGHCVFSHQLGGWMTSVEVIPALDGEAKPFGSAVGTRLRAVDGWIEDRSPEYDYGAILLDRPLGIQTGAFTVEALADPLLSGSVANIAGYPSDREQASRMYFHARTLQNFGARRVQYDVDTFGGQSGSPVWISLPDGSRRVIAIHTNGLSPGVRFNSGTRIIPEVLANLRRWMEEAAAEAAPGLSPPAPAEGAEAPAPGAPGAPPAAGSLDQTPGAPGAPPATPAAGTPAAARPPIRPTAAFLHALSPATGAPETPSQPSRPAWKVTGKVTDRAGRPVPGATVAIASGSQPYPEIAAISAGDGSFALPTHEPGSYTVNAYTRQDKGNATVAVGPDLPGSVTLVVGS